ncbi:S8 family peptidase [Pseudoduganella sp. GCM10020061]|uniref:S8 family peptidase n=1 Tax=Pseudoduganella sp. GCM10020061 TaxID=3317345 RepID=UPI00362FFDFA
MKHLSVVAPVLLACLALPAFAGGDFRSPQQEAAKATPRTDRLIVKYKDAAPAGKGAARVPPINAQQLEHLGQSGRAFGATMRQLRSTATGAHVIEVSRKLNRAEAEALARDLKARDSSIEYVEPDYLLQPMATPNDPSYNQQWHYFEPTGGMRANLAWDKATGAGVNVAVIDSGYLPHADLSGQILPGYDFISSATMANDGGGRDNDARDTGDAVNAGECYSGSAAQNSSWHGTHVTGTIGARTNNGAGVAGVAYGAKTVPVRVLGKCGGYTSDIADGIIWASGGTITGVPLNANRARVLNLSLGGSGSCSITSQSAINSARSRGSVVVVAAGNSSIDAANTNPANCAGVVTVAATQRNGGRAGYSNYGAVVDLAAPGGGTGGAILSTLNTGTRAPLADSYAWYQGTSMATPHVAGVAALMLSKNPNLTPDEVEAKLKSTARPFPAACSGCGAGILDASRAVDAALPAATPSVNMAEREPNNTMATYNAVTASGTIVTGSMAAATDNDYFLVQLPAGKSLTATLTMSSPVNDYDVYAYNPSGSLVAASQNGFGQTDTVKVQNTGTTTAPYYVRVKFTGGNYGGTASSYTLRLTW